MVAEIDSRVSCEIEIGPISSASLLTAISDCSKATPSLNTMISDAPEKLPLKHDSVIRALDALQVPIVTTNYDHLIERVTDLPGVTWIDKHKIQNDAE